MTGMGAVLISNLAVLILIKISRLINIVMLIKLSAMLKVKDVENVL